MMRKWFTYGLLLFAVLAGGLSCTREVPGPEDALGGRQLGILPTLLQQLQPTRAKDETDQDIAQGDEVNARDDMRENYFGTLDVFVKRQDAAETAPWFKEYHLTETTADEGIAQIEHLLTTDWAQEGFVPGVKYDIYATANNPHTASGIASLKALKDLTTTKIHLYQYYSPSDPGNGSNYITVDDENGILHKRFLMDGKIDGWEIDPDASKQVWDMDLARAAAKILVLVRFDGDSENVLIADEETNEALKDGEGRDVYGSLKDYLSYNHRSPGLPRAKYVRFNFTASDIAEGGYEPETEDLVTDSGNFICIKEGLLDANNNVVSNIDDQYVVVTYSYPFSWDGHPERIPYLLLSVFYSKDDDPSAEQTRSYYRIPVCDEAAVTGLERNKIYIVDVLLSSMGSSNEAVEAQDEELRIEYHVIPWTETNMTQEATTVRLSDTKYLMVTPQEYILKGDHTQSIDLQYFASVSPDDQRYVDLENISITYVNKDGNTVNITGTPTKQIRQDNGTLGSGTPDGRHDIVYTCTAPSTGANSETVTITITPAGIIRVESQALDSRAVKNISFDVILTSSGLSSEHVSIRHFPLDNIQSITGEWSSRWNEGYQTVYAVTLTEAQTWESYQITDDYYLVTKEEYNQATADKYITSQETVTNLTNAQKSTIFSTQSSNNTNTTNQRCYNSGHTSFDNAVYYASDGYYYWVVRTGSNNNYTYTYYRRGYAAQLYYNENGVPDTGSWVAWGEKNGTTSEGIFTAKVYYNGQCYPISTYNTRGSGNNYTNLKNNHMYVIQITSTSNKYALGKPVLDGNYQSQDKVASPAFMIASQLGAVTSTNNAVTASTHCGTYMEVGTDGKRYVGWRLPTKQEIEVIIGYQNGEHTGGITMVEVLGGLYYWALDGTTAYVSTGSQGSATNAYVRCVRDLTVEEINQLNNQ